MKYFKHFTDDRHDPESELILLRFGAKGYGWFQIIKEMVGENVRPDNFKEWGMLDPKKNIEAIARNCYATAEEIKEFLTFCDKEQIFEVKKNCLYYPAVLERLDEYAERVKGKKRVGRKSGHSRDKVVQSPDIYKEEDKEEDKESKPKKVTEEYLEFWNKTFGTRYTATDALLPNLEYWLKYYSMEEIKRAVKICFIHEFWSKKINPEILLRRRNPNQEQVDRINEMLNYQVTKKIIVDFIRERFPKPDDAFKREKWIHFVKNFAREYGFEI